MTDDELLALIQLARNVEWRLQLDRYEAVALRELLRAVQRAEEDVLARIATYAGSLPEWAEDRSLAVLDEMSDLTLALQNLTEDGIAQIATRAGTTSFLVHNDIVSFGGRVANFNNISITAEQLESMLLTTPVGGNLLRNWVANNYSGMVDEIRSEIMSGMLIGEDYGQFVNRLTEGFGMARDEATTLARTYVQSVNVGAQESTYQANQDIIKGVKWMATLEPGYKKKGTGVCLSCAALDGRVYGNNQTHPPCPLHPNCRCVLVPEMVTWREMGVDIDEMEEAYRPYTIRPDKKIGTGGRRTILEHGFHGGDYSSWFETQSPTFKKNLLGPRRFDLLESGSVSFKDLVNPETGRLYLLKELI